LNGSFAADNLGYFIMDNDSNFGIFKEGKIMESLEQSGLALTLKENNTKIDKQTRAIYIIGFSTIAAGLFVFFFLFWYMVHYDVAAYLIYSWKSGGC